MKLPGRMLDLSVPLDNDTVLDPPIMRPKIDYKSNKENAWMLLGSFPGLRAEDLPDGEGWAFELVQFTTHNGTHMDAPYHFQSETTRGEPMMTIDQVPLDWFFRPGVKLDFRALPAAEVELELKRIGQLKPFDIVLVNTRAASCIGTDEYMSAGCGMGREATLYLTSRGVRVCGIDAWGWDAPFVHTRKRWEETRDPSIIWEGHKAGREIPYCHMGEALQSGTAPAARLYRRCFPHKVKGLWRLDAGGRAIRLIDESYALGGCKSERCRRLSPWPQAGCEKAVQKFCSMSPALLAGKHACG